jgi:FkbM family methyltransferase
MKSYSQYYQDFFIHILFPKKNGVFLDIGANDGITFSNTCFFEKKKNWTGLCIEPNIDIFAKCMENRSCFMENCCIADEEKTVTFRKITGADMLSGIVEYMDESSIRRIDDHIKEHGGYYTDLKIQTHKINKLLEKYQLYAIDFCSIDVEGAEYGIVKSLDFDKYTIAAFAIEGKDPVLAQFLSEKKYKAIPSENDTFYIKEGTKRMHWVAFLIRMYVFSCKVRRHLPDFLKKTK